MDFAVSVHSVTNGLHVLQDKAVMKVESDQKPDIQSRKKTGGRQKGSKNKAGATAKENVIAVFTRLGGTAQMARWANDNLTDFYKLYAKLIPMDVNASINLPKGIKVEFIDK